MHIPAMDSVRHERVGIISAKNNAVSMVVQAYVRTEETDEFGVEDPIEGFARPFPLMSRSTEPTVIESVINTGTLTPFSDELIEYIALLHESATEGDWVDEIEDFDYDSLSDNEDGIAMSLQYFITQDVPQTIWRTIYEKADKFVNAGADSFKITTNPLRDIEGRERYQFEYLPAIDNVDEWTIVRYDSESEDEEGNTLISEGLWLRYKQGDTEQEYPLISFQNEACGYSVASPNVEYGADVMNEVSSEFVNAILSNDESLDSNLTPFDVSELDGTRTLEYLESF